MQILVDPFFTDEVIFSSPYLLAYPKHPSREGLETGNFDAIVLTQHLPDHMHIPTLKLIDKSVPVFAPPACEQVLRDELGFEQVFVIGEQSIDMTTEVQITGHLNAFVITFGDRSVYYEPHGMHSNEYLSKFSNRVDLAIAPVVSFNFMRSVFRGVSGAPEAVELCKLLHPKTLIGIDTSTCGIARGIVYWLSTERDERPQLLSQFKSDKSLSDIKLVLPEVLGERITV